MDVSLDIYDEFEFLMGYVFGRTNHFCDCVECITSYDAHSLYLLKEKMIMTWNDFHGTYWSLPYEERPKFILVDKDNPERDIESYEKVEARFFEVQRLVHSDLKAYSKSRNN